MLRYSKRGRHSDEDVQLFMSTSGMNSESTQGRKGRQPKPELDREYSDLTKQKHEQIVKTLLDEFDLEATKDKYRGSQQEISYVPKSKGLSDFGFRSQLRKLMGTEVIRLNDRKWNEELENRIHEEFERRLDLHEEALAEAEVLRIRKLRLEGVLSLTDDDLDYSENCRRKEKEKSRGKRRKVKHRKRSQSPQNNRRRSSSPSRSSWRRSPEHVSTQVELMEDSASEKESSVDGYVRSKKEESNSGKRFQRADSPQAHKHKTKRKTRRQVPAEKQKSYNEEVTNSPQAQEHETKPKPRRPVPAKIQELYDEESVDGLYSLADKLVIADTGPKVKVKVKCS